METTPNPNESTLRNAEIADIQKTIEAHIQETKELLQIALDELSGATAMLEIAQQKLEIMQYENSWITRNEKLAEQFSMSSVSAEDIEKVKIEIQQHEKDIQKFRDFTTSFIQDVAVFQGQIDELNTIEKIFKEPLTGIPPESSQ